MDKDYCSVRFMRMLKTINIIHQIQTSGEFSDFYHWLNDFYQIEIRELIGDVHGDFLLNTENLQNDFDFEKTVSSYIFDCIQYGRNKINRGSEALLIKYLGNDLFVKETDRLCFKFKMLLVGDEQLKEAYIKLTEHIDIRYLVMYRFNPEHLFLTWFSIENYFSMLAQRTKPLTTNEKSTTKEFEEQIYRYLHDFEILAKNKGYEIGHVTLTDSAMFKDEAHREDYLTLRLAENFKVPVVDALLDYLEFAKFKLNHTHLLSNPNESNNLRLDQLHRIIQILSNEKNQKAAQQGAGVIRLLCYTIYNLNNDKFLDPKQKKNNSIKKFLDYLANLLQLVGIKYSYNAAAKNKANLKIVVNFTNSAIRSDLFALYQEFLSKTTPVIQLSKFMVSTEVNSDSGIDLYKEVTKDVSLYRENKLFDITLNNLTSKINDQSKEPFNFSNLYIDN